MSRTSDGPYDNHILYRSLTVFPTATGPSRWEKRLLHCSDSFLSLFVVAPLVVCHWRGTWSYMDLFPRIFPGMNCMILGAIVHVCLAILREPLHAKYNSLMRLQKKSLTKSFNLFIVKKIYTYVFSISCIMHWFVEQRASFNIVTHLIRIFHSTTSVLSSRRGGWAVMEEHLGEPISIKRIFLSVLHHLRR